MAKADQELKVRAVELAVASGAGTNVIGMATSILAFLTDTAAPAAPAADPPKPSTTDTSAGAAGTGSGASSGSAASGTSTSDGAGQDNGSGNGAAAGAGAAAAGGGNVQDTATFDGNVKTLQDKCMALSGRDGAAALLAQFNKVGAGKWSEVPAEKYPELFANLVAAGV